MLISLFTMLINFRNRGFLLFSQNSISPISNDQSVWTSSLLSKKRGASLAKALSGGLLQSFVGWTGCKTLPSDPFWRFANATTQTYGGTSVKVDLKYYSRESYFMSLNI